MTLPLSKERELKREFISVCKNIDNIVVANAFNESYFEESGVPINVVIVNTPKLPLNRRGGGTTLFDRSGTLLIDVFCATSDDLQDLTGEIIIQIKENIDSFSVKDIRIGEATSIEFEAGAGVIQVQSIPISFKLLTN